MTAINPAVKAVEDVSRLTHGQLTPEGQKDIEEKIKMYEGEIVQREAEVALARQSLVYMTSVLLCHHEIIPYDDGRYRCRVCKFRWFKE